MIEFRDEVGVGLADLDVKPGDALLAYETVESVVGQVHDDGVDGLVDAIDGHLDALADARDREDDLRFRSNLSPLGVAALAVVAGSAGWYVYKCHVRSDDGRCAQRRQLVTVVINAASVIATVA